MQMQNPNMPFPKNVPINLQAKDKPALQELSDHMKKILEVLDAFKKGRAKHEQVADAFRRVLHDTSSHNLLENKLARYIVNELKLLKLKIKENGVHYTAFRFLEAYWNGDIKDAHTIEQGFLGLAAPGTIAILKNCKMDLIMKEYET